MTTLPSQISNRKMTGASHKYKPLSSEDTLSIVQQAPVRPIHPNPSIAWILIFFNFLCHFIIGVFTIYIFYLAFKDGAVLFSWHPTCLTLGFFGFMSNAVISQSHFNLWGYNLSHNAKVTYHWILQACASTLIAIGFFVIVANKNINNAEHFATNHGLYGLLSFLSVIGVGLGGILALYSQKVKKMISPKYIKIIHSLFGTLTYLLSSITFILGIYSHWYTRQNSEDMVRFSVVGVASVIILILLSLLFSSYKRIF